MKNCQARGGVERITCNTESRAYQLKPSTDNKLSSNAARMIRIEQTTIN
ncbi:MAG: hypothetical protein ACXWCX_00890 [Burkholderiales bacterium]